MRELLKGTLQSSLGTVFTLLFGAIVIKIIAVINGPEGVGLFSILRQLQQTGVVMALVGGQTAVIQGIARFEGRQQADFLHAAFRLILYATVVTIFILVVAAPTLSHWIFSDKVANATRLIYWSIISILFASIFAFLSSVLNGHRLLGQLAKMQVMGAVVGGCIAYPLALWFSSGSTVSYILLLAIPFALSSVGAFVVASRRGYLSPLFDKLSVKLSSYEAKYFVSFASTTLVTTLVQAGVLLAIRALIVRKYGLVGVGEFDASWTLSMMYVMLVLNSFAGYYLPTLSKITDVKARSILIERVIKLSLIAMIPLVTFVISFKGLYIRVFYTHDFLSSLDMIRWMLLGDYLKVTSWIFAISMLAYAQMKLFFITEMLWNASFLLVAAWVIHHYDSLEAIGVTFLISYFCYLIFTAVYIRYKWHFYMGHKTIAFWLAGVVYLLFVSIMTWNQQSIEWGSSMVWMILAGVLVLSFIGKDPILRVIQKIRG